MKLKELRKKLGKTQYQVAEDLDINRVTYTNYEIGKREPDNVTIVKLADYFGVTTDYLLGHETKPDIGVWDKEQGRYVPVEAKANSTKKEAPPSSDMDEREALRDALIKAGIIPADRDLTPEEAKVLLGAAKGVFESFDK